MRNVLSLLDFWGGNVGRFSILQGFCDLLDSHIFLLLSDGLLVTQHIVQAGDLLLNVIVQINFQLFLNLLINLLNVLRHLLLRRFG